MITWLKQRLLILKPKALTFGERVVLPISIYTIPVLIAFYIAKVDESPELALENVKVQPVLQINDTEVDDLLRGNRIIQDKILIYGSIKAKKDFDGNSLTKKTADEVAVAFNKYIAISNNQFDKLNKSIAIVRRATNQIDLIELDGNMISGNHSKQAKKLREYFSDSAKNVFEEWSENQIKLSKPYVLTAQRVVSIIEKGEYTRNGKAVFEIVVVNSGSLPDLIKPGAVTLEYQDRKYRLVPADKTLYTVVAPYSFKILEFVVDEDKAYPEDIIALESTIRENNSGEYSIIIQLANGSISADGSF